MSEETAGNGAGQAPPPYVNQFGGPAAGPESFPSAEAQAVPGSVLGVASRSASYIFDRAGNRVTQTIDGVTTTLAYNSASQLVSETAPGRGVTHQYDEWGNEVVRTTDGTVVETYGYNYLNLMSAYANASAGAAWQYDFWPTGERYGKTNLGNNTSELYIPRAGDVVTEYARASGGAITHKNSYAQGTGIDQKYTRISAAGERRHYLGDQVGTVSVTLTDAGAVAEVGLKDAWGVEISGGTPSERYGFAQREHDSESGLVHMRGRMYDPRLGRFTQTDPLRASRSREHYLFGFNNPITTIDPMGLLGEEAKTQDSVNETKTVAVIIVLDYSGKISGRNLASDQDLKDVADSYSKRADWKKHSGSPDEVKVIPMTDVGLDEKGKPNFSNIAKEMKNLKKDYRGVTAVTVIGHGGHAGKQSLGMVWPTSDKPTLVSGVEGHKPLAKALESGPPIHWPKGTSSNDARSAIELAGCDTGPSVKPLAEAWPGSGTPEGMVGKVRGYKGPLEVATGPGGGKEMRVPVPGDKMYTKDDLTQVEWKQIRVNKP